MNVIDFVYDGITLSNKGYIVCDFDYSSGANVSSIGSNISFSLVPQHRGMSYGLTSTKYDECLTASFDICKNPDEYFGEDREISNSEISDLMKWLNRRQFRKFKFIDFVDTDCVIYYNASFNVEKITIGGKVFGMRLTMETDKPFGYGDTVTISHTFTNSSNLWNILPQTDDVGYIVPISTKITCSQTGNIDFKIVDYSNSSEIIQRPIIKNCTSSEVITIYGETETIISTRSAHLIQNDFNYEFPKLFTFNLRSDLLYQMSIQNLGANCTIEIKYNPIIKNYLY